MLSQLKKLKNLSHPTVHAAIAVLSVTSQCAYAHTSSIGYTNAGPGSVAFWYGTYHNPVGYTEGSLQLTGPSGYSSTAVFTLLTNSKPTGLIDGTNNFYSNGTALVGTYSGTIRNWQGTTFTGLQAGTYTFTYIPIASPTSVWRPIDSVILSSSVVLDASILGINVLSSASTMHNTPALPAARIIDANPSLQALFSGLSGDAAISSATSQTLPLLTGGSIIATNSALSSISRVVQARVENNRGMSSGDDFMGDKYFWMKPFGSWANQNDSNGVSGFKADTWGVVLGADKLVSNTTRLGVAFAYANSNVNSKSTVAPNSADVDVYQLAGYGSYSLDNSTDINFQLNLGQNRNAGQRVIAFVSSIANAHYDSLTAHAGIGAEHILQLKENTQFIPSVRVDYTWVSDDAYTETGAGLLNLKVASRRVESLVLGVDGKFVLNLSDKTNVNASLGVGYDTLNKQSSITAAFAGAPSAAFVTYGLDPSPWTGHAGFGLTHIITNGAELTARYDAEYRQGFLNQTASAKMRWTF